METHQSIVFTVAAQEGDLKIQDQIRFGFELYFTVKTIYEKCFETKRLVNTSSQPLHLQ